MGSYGAFNRSGTHAVHRVCGLRASRRWFVYTGGTGFSVYTDVIGIFTPQYW